MSDLRQQYEEALVRSADSDLAMTVTRASATRRRLLTTLTATVALLAGVPVVAPEADAARRQVQRPLTGDVRGAGDGCPADSLSSLTSPDGTTTSVLFSAFTGSLGPGSEGPAAARCSLSFPVAPAADGVWVPVTVRYHGFADLQPEVSLQRTAGYVSSSRPADVKRRQGQVLAVDSYWEVVDEVPRLYVRCGEPWSLAITTTFALRAPRGVEQAGLSQFAVDDLDATAGGALDVQFRLEDCAEAGAPGRAPDATPR